jgi:conjugal transfer pilus assembly protein TraD
VSVHSDEFNELIGYEFVRLLDKAGGPGFGDTICTLTRIDVEAKTGSEAKAGQIEGNLDTLVMLRVREHMTAELLTEQLPQVGVPSIMIANGATDSADPTDTATLTSRNENRISAVTVDMLEPADLVRQPKG